MKHCCSGSNCKSRCLKYAALGLIGVTIAGLVVMWLWNWLLPELFGWKTIGFLQAVGLLVLSKILFGSFHCRHRCHSHHAGALDNLSAEEREKLQAGLRSCCGGDNT